jgi:hypothetical protein
MIILCWKQTRPSYQGKFYFAKEQPVFKTVNFCFEAGTKKLSYLERFSSSGTGNKE